MKKLSILSIFVITVILNGCAIISVTNVQPQMKNISEPPLNQEVTRSIGEELMSQGKMDEVRAIEILKDANYGDVKTGTYKMTGYYYKGKMRREIYEPVPNTGAYIKFNESGGFFLDPRLFDRFMKLFLYPDKNELAACSMRSNDLVGYCNENIPTTDYKVSTVAIQSNNNFQQGLIYTGKQGDIVKFLYREFKNDMARPAFNVDVTYDLKDGDEIAFKSARLKIIKATNSSITYIVLKNFE